MDVCRLDVFRQRCRSKDVVKASPLEVEQVRETLLRCRGFEKRKTSRLLKIMPVLIQVQQIASIVAAPEYNMLASRIFDKGAKCFYRVLVSATPRSGKNYLTLNLIVRSFLPLAYINNTK